MRELSKLPEPQILVDNHATWSADYISDPKNKTKKYRYRHPDIKTVLKTETAEKCVYCESKIGHNTPGDVEHKIPSSKNPGTHFTWSNLTIACTECNRRKDAYLDPGKPFLDPYTDPVETLVVHHGPITCWLHGNSSAEITVKTLELDTDARLPVIMRKIEKIASINNLIERIKSSDDTMRSVLLIQLRKYQSAKEEYSAMVRAICLNVGL